MKLSRNSWLALVIAGIVAADWITKAAVQQRLRLSDRRVVIDGLLTIQHNWNPGIAWGWLRWQPASTQVAQPWCSCNSLPSPGD